MSISKIAYGIRQWKEQERLEQEMAKSSTSYIDRNGNFLTKSAYESRLLNRDFTVVREFENDTLYAKITFNGAINNKSIPKEHWTPFRLDVENILITDGDGRPLEKPVRCKDVDASNEFRTEQEAINSYEDLLVRHAGCEFFPGSDGTFIFNERGNKLTPPSPDLPAAVEGCTDETVSSW